MFHEVEERCLVVEVDPRLQPVAGRQWLHVIRAGFVVGAVLLTHHQTQRVLEQSCEGDSVVRRVGLGAAKQLIRKADGRAHAWKHIFVTYICHELRALLHLR